MLWKIIQFELRYRAKRPATYIYFGILFLICMLAVTWENLSIGGASGRLKEDAPSVIMVQTVIMSIIGIFISSAIMGVPVLRDFQHRTYSMLFTSPIKKRDYLFGRFIGSLIVLILILSGISLGLMAGRLWPLNDPERFLPTFRVAAYLWPFALIVVPNAIISGALFFMGGALSKRLLFVFVQGLGLFVLYLITGQLLSEVDNIEIAARLDPFGLRMQSGVARYWTISEQNTRLLPLTGLVLQNRLIWLGIAAAALATTYFTFSFSTPRKRASKQKKEASTSTQSEISIPKIQHFAPTGLRTQLLRIWHLSRLYYKEIVGSIPFIAIVSFGLIFVIISSMNLGGMYGTDSFPKTFLILEVLKSFELFFFIIVIFYAGELIWRERDLRINQIYDTLPFPNDISLLSKFTGFMMVHATILLALIVIGIITQISLGYFDFELEVYFSKLFSETFSFLALFSLFAFFVQVMVNNKFLGHGVMILFFITITFVFNEIGLEHPLFDISGGSLGAYSDMNNFNFRVLSFSWDTFYGVAFSLVLSGIAVAFSVRGTDTVFKTRTHLARQRFARPLLIFTSLALIMLFTAGGIVYYNTTVLNEFVTSDERQDLQEAYERELKQYMDKPQPRIVETNLAVDIFPYSKDVDIKGFYVMKNKTAEAIDTLFIQFPVEQELNYKDLIFTTFDSSWNGSVSLLEMKDKFSFAMYQFEPALQPEDSIKVSFDGAYRTLGFKESGSGNVQVVRNGTFFNTSYFPAIGYDVSFEMGSDDERRKRGLPEKERSRPINDSIGLHNNLIGDDADNIRFEILMSTSDDQVALAPGYLQEQFDKDGRRYFRYKMDIPMFNFYSLVSAKYDIVKEKWLAPFGDSINLEIYYHKGHAYNLDRMMQGMKDALAYYSTNFSPYQFRQMRIMEFPRYRSFAQSFANTVPFSESMGFILDVGEDDVDIAYYVTAHEMAHQWWGHQVTQAQVRGAAMMSETLSQYSALMVMKQAYGPEMMQKFLKYELDRYLGGRRLERKKERPLMLVEGQGYIHYRKGSLVMYALQDYIGEDSINSALNRFVDDWAFREDLYPTTIDLLAYFRDVTPDTLQYLITDMFENITLYENRMRETEYTELENGQYQVDMTIHTVKYVADSLGTETQVSMDDWIDVGIFVEDQKGKDSLIYLQKHRFNQDTTNLEIVVDMLPLKAGIDPINKLIDRNPNDNRKNLNAKEE
ncbi:MAG: M1 family aminopeptidase [Bacteroidota bacterium]